jgi:ribonuclease inhibitor
MKTVFLTGDNLTHDTLAQAFGFPEYYGRNLDALHDCLCEIGEETAIVMTDMDEENPQARPFLDVLADSARENPRLSLYVAVQIA